MLDMLLVYIFTALFFFFKFEVPLTDFVQNTPHFFQTLIVFSQKKPWSSMLYLAVTLFVSVILGYLGIIVYIKEFFQLFFVILFKKKNLMIKHRIPFLITFYVFN